MNNIFRGLPYACITMLGLVVLFTQIVDPKMVIYEFILLFLGGSVFGLAWLAGWAINKISRRCSNDR